MKTIWKFEVPVTDEPVVMAPAGAVFLPTAVFPYPGSVGWLWAIVDSDAPKVRVRLRIVGAGHPLTEVGAYITTAHSGPFVWHIFHAPARRVITPDERTTP